MSYILDALRRAQAERERGQVPGLAAQPPMGRAPAAPGRAAPTTWLVAGLGGGLVLGVLVVALVGWGRSAGDARGGEPGARAAADARIAAAGRESDRPGASPTLTPAPGTAPPQALSPAASAPPRLPVMVSAPPVAPPALAPSATAPQPRLPPQVPSLSPSPPVSPGSPLPGAAAPAPVFGGVVVTPPLRPPAGASGAEADPLLLTQLLPAQRRELPALSVGGVIWSESPASRFVILDGQVVREGGSVAPGVTLERIERQAAILRWRGGRLRLPL
ncbi:MAG: general secretion pathway protein GspB [Rubrivivax sp.]